MLSGVLCLWAALVYLKFDESRRLDYVLALALFLTALAAKTVTATLPAGRAAALCRNAVPGIGIRECLPVPLLVRGRPFSVPRQPRANRAAVRTIRRRRRGRDETVFRCSAARPCGPNLPADLAVSRRRNLVSQNAGGESGVLDGAQQPGWFVCQTAGWAGGRRRLHNWQPRSAPDRMLSRSRSCRQV